MSVMAREPEREPVVLLSDEYEWVDSLPFTSEHRDDVIPESLSEIERESLGQKQLFAGSECSDDE